MSAIKELLPEVIKTGDYAHVCLQIPKGFTGAPFLLTMTGTFIETGRQGWYGDRVHCTVLWDDGENVRHIGNKTVEFKTGQTEMSEEICQWINSLGGFAEQEQDAIVYALGEMLPF